MGQLRRAEVFIAVQGVILLMLFSIAIRFACERLRGDSHARVQLACMFECRPALCTAGVRGAEPYSDQTHSQYKY